MVLPCLNNGVTLDNLHSSGNIPVAIDLLKIQQRCSAIKSADSRRNLAEILSKPVALDLHNLDNKA